jgi:hypothetical protein
MRKFSKNHSANIFLTTDFSINYNAPRYQLFIILTLFSMTQDIYDLLFCMLTAQKSLKKKDSDKNRIPLEVFSLHVLLQDFPPKMMHFDYCKKVQKSESPGHVRPGLWKSCHPREEK